jgi:hypothetical protein
MIEFERTASRQRRSFGKDKHFVAARESRRVNRRPRAGQPALEGAPPHVIVADACLGSQLLLCTTATALVASRRRFAAALGFVAPRRRFAAALGCNCDS